MVRIEKSIEIRAPPEKVWEMLALDRHPEWQYMLELQSAKYISEINTPEDKYKVGASAHVIEKRWEYDLNVLESVTNERLKLRSQGKYIITSEYTLKPIDEGTRLTVVAETEMPGGILGRALGGLGRRYMEKEFGKASEKLKSILEK